MSDTLCELTELPPAWCAHCQGTPDLEEEDSFEVLGRPFDAQFPGRCTIDYDHNIRRGDLVARVQRADNPMLPVQGVACSACVRILPRVKR